MLKEIAKILSSTVLMLGFVFYSYAVFEPVRVMAVEEDEDQIIITQDVIPGITISSPSDIVLTPLTLMQDTAVGSTTWNVITNNQAGYILTIKASTTPALHELTTLEAFADYTVTTGEKELWDVVNAYEFGWSALGNNVTGHGTDTTNDCAAAYDVPSAELLWQGFDGTTPIQMASSTSETNQTGTETTICVATEQNIVFAPSGTYYATTTATATTQ
jgi:hypothetical protein